MENVHVPCEPQQGIVLVSQLMDAITGYIDFFFV